MFRFSRIRQFVAFAAVEPGAPPASEPAAPNPGAGQPAGFGDAQAAAAARVDAAFPKPLPPGAPADVATAATAPPAEPAAFDMWADDADESMIPDDMPYRDAMKLRGEIKQARETFRPFRDAFGGMDEDERGRFLAAAPSAGPDLVTFAQLAPQLHPDDRAYMMDAMSLMATDPAKAAQMLADGADVLRRQFAPDGNQPPADLSQQPLPDPAALSPEEQPMTRAQLDAYMRQRDFEATVADSESKILTKARELGYDPDATDAIADGRFRTFIAMAARPEVDGDLDRAHQLMQEMDQATIDQFVSAKAADADRPGAPAMGATPADVQVLDTLDDARAASNARLDAALGPDPRRRGSD